MPEEYWDLFVDLRAGKNDLRAEVVRHKGNPYKPTNEGEINIALEAL